MVILTDLTGLSLMEKEIKAYILSKVNAELKAINLGPEIGVVVRKVLKMTVDKIVEEQKKVNRSLYDKLTDLNYSNLENSKRVEILSIELSKNNLIIPTLKEELEKIKLCNPLKEVNDSELNDLVNGVIVRFLKSNKVTKLSDGLEYNKIYKEIFQKLCLFTDKNMRVSGIIFGKLASLERSVFHYTGLNKEVKLKFFGLNTHNYHNEITQESILEKEYPEYKTKMYNFIKKLQTLEPWGEVEENKYELLKNGLYRLPYNYTLMFNDKYLLIHAFNKETKEMYVVSPFLLLNINKKLSYVDTRGKLKGKFKDSNLDNLVFNKEIREHFKSVYENKKDIKVKEFTEIDYRRLKRVFKVLTMEKDYFKSLGIQLQLNTKKLETFGRVVTPVRSYLIGSGYLYDEESKVFIYNNGKSTDYVGTHLNNLHEEILKNKKSKYKDILGLVSLLEKAYDLRHNINV